MSKENLEEEITNGRFPPCFLYKILYTSPEEKRIRPNLMLVHVHGANVSLVFSCRVQEELCECVHVGMCKIAS